MPNGSYSQLTLTAAISQLGQRLNITPSTTSLWTITELQIILTTVLRMMNSLTWTWRQDFTFNIAGPAPVWTSLGALAGSPRLRTLYDTDAYTELEYLLLEPPSGQVWTGTNQFSISVLSQALQRRRDEMIQYGNLNQVLLPTIPLTPNTSRTLLPDTVIDVERVRYIPATINNPPFAPVTPAPTTLYRDDTVAQEFYEAPLYQQAPGTPSTFSLSSEPPLSWQVDVPPNLPGVYEALVLQSGTPFDPPTPTLIGIPNDLVYMLEFGALADLLGQEAESTDRERADYCMRKYQDGLQLMMKTPWIGLGKVNGQAVSIDSIYAMDRYSCNWDSQPTSFGPVIVAGGVDTIAVPVAQDIGCTVLANAPILDSTNTYLQVSPAQPDAMYVHRQARAFLKLGGPVW